MPQPGLTLSPPQVLTSCRAFLLAARIPSKVSAGAEVPPAIARTHAPCTHVHTHTHTVHTGHTHTHHAHVHTCTTHAHTSKCTTCTVHTQTCTMHTYAHMHHAQHVHTLKHAHAPCTHVQAYTAHAHTLANALQTPPMHHSQHVHTSRNTRPMCIIHGAVQPTPRYPCAHIHPHHTYDSTTHSREQSRGSRVWVLFGPITFLGGRRGQTKGPRLRPLSVGA